MDTTTGTPVDESTGASNIVKNGRGSTELLVNINDGTEALEVSVESGVTGSQNTLTLTYKLTQDFASNAWFWMKIPKANLLYNVGGNNGNDAVSLVDTSNYSKPTVTIGGSNMVVEDNTIYYLKGDNFDPDTWAFTFDFSNFNTIAAGVNAVI